MKQYERRIIEKETVFEQRGVFYKSYHEYAKYIYPNGYSLQTSSPVLTKLSKEDDSPIVPTGEFPKEVAFTSKAWIDRNVMLCKERQQMRKDGEL